MSGCLTSNSAAVRRILRLGLEGFASPEPDRIACTWAALRLWQWVPHAGDLAADLEDLARRLGDLGEPAGRVYRDQSARARAVDEARTRLTAVLERIG